MEVTQENLVLIKLYLHELIFSKNLASFAIQRREIIVNWQFIFSRCAIGEPISIDEYQSFFLWKLLQGN